MKRANHWLSLAAILLGLMGNMTTLLAEDTPSPIKVGIIVSRTTATGPNFAGTPQGYKHAAIADQLRDKSTELFAVVDPDTENDPDVSKTVRRFFPANRVINGADAKALKGLAVIVAHDNSNMQPEVIDAMIEAIEGGVGFLCVNSTVGGVSPADPERMDKLHGLTSAQFYYHPKPLECIVLAQHPLTASLTADGVKTLTIKGFDGMSGELKGEPLIGIKDDSGDAGNSGASTQPQVRTDFYPLYVSALGKGRIVSCQWETMPDAIKKASRGRFYVQCAQWLASGRTKE